MPNSRTRSASAAPADSAPADSAHADPLALPLTLTFPCRPAPHEPAARHPIVIRADWTVETGHDEELESIAAALGSGVSCITELASVLPAFREWWRRATRRAGPMIHATEEGRRWHCADGRFACCPTSGFASPEPAGAHAREARHVAAVTGAQRRHLTALVAGLGRRADPPAPAVPGTPPEAHDLLAQAWAAGLAPTAVTTIAPAFAAQGLALDLPALLGLAQTGADPHWLLRTAAGLTSTSAHVPHADGPGAAGAYAAKAVLPPPDPPGRQGLLAWLAWTATALDAREPGARRAWLATGTRRADIVRLSEAGYRATAAADVAEAWGVSVPGAAQTLARWVSAGFQPHPAHLTALRDVGLAYPPGPPAPVAVDRLGQLLGVSAPDVRERTGLAVSLVRHGTLQGAAVALVRAREGKGRIGQRSA